jgi:hypothetical protein
VSGAPCKSPKRPQRGPGYRINPGSGIKNRFQESFVWVQIV